MTLLSNFLFKFNYKAIIYKQMVYLNAHHIYFIFYIFINSYKVHILSHFNNTIQ